MPQTSLPEPPPAPSRAFFSHTAPSTTVLATLAGLALMAVLATACGDSEPPVGSVAVEPAEVTLPYPESRQVELAWSPEEAVEAPSSRPRVFVHLLPEEDKEVLRTFDHRLPEAWRPGSEVRYPLELHQSMLGPPLPAGTYRLTAGLYHEDRRWPLEGGEEAGSREYTLGRVEVPAAQPEDLPKLEYEGHWSPLNAGTDRQVLGFRYIGADATLRVSDVPEDGTLGIGLEINPAPEGFDRVPAAAEDPDPAEGEPEGDADGGNGDGGGDADAGGGTVPAADPGIPALHVVVTCDGSESVLSGLGRSDVTVDLTAGTDCSLRLRPNYAHRPAAGQEPDAQEVSELARLVQVTWNPGS